MLGKATLPYFVSNCTLGFTCQQLVATQASCQQGREGGNCICIAWVHVAPALLWACTGAGFAILGGQIYDLLYTLHYWVYRVYAFMKPSARTEADSHFNAYL